MTISIWYQAEGLKPEVVDRAHSKIEANRLEIEYSMAFGTRPGQHRYGKDFVWAGRKNQNPSQRT